MQTVMVIITCLFIYTCGQVRGDWCVPESSKCLKEQAKLKVEEAKALQNRETLCHTPRLISSAIGVNLYVTGNSSCTGEVYFSRSGTHTTHKACHMSGKVNHCDTINDDVSNGHQDDN